MRHSIRTCSALGAAMGCTMIASVAGAQDLGGTAPPAQPPAQQTAAAATAGAPAGGETDHDRVVNQVGLRYFGLVGTPAGMGTPAVGVHNVGARYWLSRGLGVEGGVGLSLVTGAGTRFGIAFNAGLPINIASSGHLAIHAVPNVTLGIPTVDPFGLALLAGADAVAELHFGFLGVPQMSLQARMGVNVALNLSGGNAVFALGTTPGEGANVWDVVTGSVSATYYFGR